MLCRFPSLLPRNQLSPREPAIPNRAWLKICSHRMNILTSANRSIISQVTGHCMPLVLLGQSSGLRPRALFVLTLSAFILSTW